MITLHKKFNSEKLWMDLT